jgi:predicted GNAT superfamily acetyltransferase
MVVVHSGDAAIRARASASAAAERSGVRVRILGSTDDTHACERFLCAVWRTPADRPPLAADVVKAMVDAGSYVAGAFDGDSLVAACVALWGPPGHPVLHSHVAGVDAAARGRDVGFALKLDQRAHALEVGIERVTWTFDPLVARNAHVNLHKLGGGASEYLPDHYGPLVDGINAGDASDRLLACWDLLDARVRAACDEGVRTPLPPAPAILSDVEGRPVVSPVVADAVRVEVPADIDTVRRTDPGLAKEWRLAVRETLGGLLAEGGRVLGFHRGYVVGRA